MNKIDPRSRDVYTLGNGGRVGLAINVKEEKIIKLVSAIKKKM